MFSLVFNPGALSSISKDVLKTTTNDNEDNSNRTIVFTIVNPPKFGKLVTVQADKSITEISSFTQEMVSAVKTHDLHGESNYNPINYTFIFRESALL